MTRTLGAEMAAPVSDEDEEEGMSYDAAMTGGEMTETYLMFGD